MGKIKVCTKFWAENLKVKGYLEDPGVDGSIILEWILRKEGGNVWTRFIWVSMASSGGLL
jgi:hypothetical protein